MKMKIIIIVGVILLLICSSSLTYYFMSGEKSNDKEPEQEEPEQEEPEQEEPEQEEPEQEEPEQEEPEQEEDKTGLFEMQIVSRLNKHPFKIKLNDTIYPNNKEAKNVVTVEEELYYLVPDENSYDIVEGDSKISKDIDFTTWFRNKDNYYNFKINHNEKIKKFEIISHESKITKISPQDLFVYSIKINGINKNLVNYVESKIDEKNHRHCVAKGHPTKCADLIFTDGGAYNYEDRKNDPAGYMWRSTYKYDSIDKIEGFETW
jgi:flagellar basal body-associated protein FliL